MNRRKCGFRRPQAGLRGHKSKPEPGPQGAERAFSKPGL